MHGLDPCIQGRRLRITSGGRRLDARLEAGHDGWRRTAGFNCSWALRCASPGGSGRCHVSRFNHQGRPEAGPEFAMTFVETSWILGEMPSVTILLNTRGTQPGQSELIDRDLPTQELVDGERITRACFLERKQATAHRGHDLGFASDHPPLGRRRRQIGDRQRASVGTYDVFHPRSKRFIHLTLTTQRNCLSCEHRELGLRFA